MAEPSAQVTVVLRRNMWQALRRGAYADANEILARLKGDDPLSLETRGLELEYLVRSGRLDEAAALSGQLVDLFPASARVHYLAGQLAYRRKDYPKAHHHLRESLHLHPHWRTQHLLGRALTQAGHLDEAEAMLLDLVPQRPECLRDLAWLYERRGDDARALRTLESFLERHPRDAFARGQRLRLRARLMEAGELLEEVDTLLALGEAVPDEVLPAWFEALLRSGQGGRAREFVREQGRRLDVRFAARLAWTCYKLQAYDLAFELFAAAFPQDRGNPKFLSAIESAAARSGNVQTLLDLYRAQAPQDKRLYGRLRSLERRRPR